MNSASKAYISALCIIFMFLSVTVSAEITIAVSARYRDDAGISLAVDDLADALRSLPEMVTVSFLQTGEPLPRTNLILVGDDIIMKPGNLEPLHPDAYRILPQALQGSRILRVEGDVRGLMYGLFKLTERVRLGDTIWETYIERSPAFPLRMFSEEGQLLDIPDFGYYSDSPPYVNETLLRNDVDEAKKLVDAIARLGFNALAVLHLSFEEYIDYRYLDKPVYDAGDPHRMRSPVFCRYLTELCDYAHARHIDLYLQLYEIQYPPKLAELYGVSLDSPNIETVIAAKTRELFERVPLDGLLITATETHPRCGYLSKQLWSDQGQAGAGKMFALYHNACANAGKRAIFRMWRIAGSAGEVRNVLESVPGDAMFAIKNTGSDFYLSFPTADVITAGIGHEQPMMVIFDTFREFDGWSRLFCYMKRWGDVVKACRDNGVTAINAWGPWSPGCIWPDWEPDYLLDGQGNPQRVRISWLGYWKQFRMFTRGFTPGQANAYLLGRLMWYPDTDVRIIARDFAALHVGWNNADAAVEALMATEDAFRELYPGNRAEVAHPVHMKWTMVFGPREEMMETAYNNYPLDMLLESNDRAFALVRRMEQAFARTTLTAAPDTGRYDLFSAGIDKTALWLRSALLWRECWWRRRAARDLTGDTAAAAAANSAALNTARDELRTLFDAWGKYPEEAGNWRITYRYGRPEITPDDTFPYWYPKGDKTMEATIDSF